MLSTQIVLFLTQCFLDYAEFVHFWQKAATNFFGLFYKKKKYFFFYCECTQIKANLLQFDNLHD